MAKPISGAVFTLNNDPNTLFGVDPSTFDKYPLRAAAHLILRQKAR